MSDKVRKQEDRSTTLKPNRISTATIPLGGGASPNLIPQPGPYPLTNDGGLPIPAPHHIPYGMMRPMGSPLSMPGLPVKTQVQSSLSNDLGPPIFMPALNLGVPKHSVTSSTVTSSSKMKNNLTQPPSMTYDMGSVLPYPMQAYHTVAAAASTSVRPIQQQQHFLPSQAIGMNPTAPQTCTSHLITTALTTSLLPSGGIVAANHKSSSSIKQPSSGSIARASPGVKSSSVEKSLPKSPVSVPSIPYPSLHVQHHSVGVNKQTASTKPVAQLKTENSTATTLHMAYSIPQSINQTQMHSVQYAHHGVLPVTPSSLPLPPVGTPHTSSLSQMLMSPSPTSLASPSSHQQQQIPVSRSTRGMAEGSATTAAQSPTLQEHVGRLPGAVTTASLTTSGQPSSTASFTDTRLERPPQPSSAGTSQPPPTHNGSSKDRLTTAEVAQNMIITVPGLTGKRIAEMPGSYPPNSTPQQGAASGGENSLQGFKSEPSPEDGWASPNGHDASSPTTSGGQLLNIQQQVPGAKTGSNAVAAPPASSGVSSPPPSHSLPPPGTQTNSSPRPRILRKRGPDGNWKVEGQSTVSGSSKLPLGTLKPRTNDGVTLPLSPGGDHTPNHLGGGGRNEPADFTASPRKKPRKQNVVGTDDQYASNVPDGGLLLEAPESWGGGGGGVGEDRTFQPPPPPSALNSITTRSTKIKPELPTKQEDNGTKEVEICYLSQLRRCPYPINGIYKLHHRVAHNHFRRHADIKHREDERTSAFDIANSRSSWERMTGWKVRRFQSQLEEVSQVESEVLDTMQRLEESIESLSQSASCQEEIQPLLEDFRELTQSNIDRSTRVISEIEGTRTAMLKVLDHKPQLSDLLKKYSVTKSRPTVFSSLPPHKTHS